MESIRRNFNQINRLKPEKTPVRHPDHQGNIHRKAPIKPTRTKFITGLFIVSILYKKRGKYLDFLRTRSDEYRQFIRDFTDLRQE